MCTKIGLNFAQSKSEEFQAWGGPCLAPDYIWEAVTDCCGRLGVECIDLVVLHRMDHKTPVEDTMQALGRGGEAPGLRAARAVLAGMER